MFATCYKYFLPVLSLLAGATFAQPEDWPQWRGPHRDGVLLPGDTPASSMALRIARMDSAPTLVCGSLSHRREVGACPIPTAATLPRCSQTPRPSCVRYIEAGIICAIVRTFL